MEQFTTLATLVANARAAGWIIAVRDLPAPVSLIISPVERTVYVLRGAPPNSPVAMGALTLLARECAGEVAGGDDAPEMMLAA